MTSKATALRAWPMCDRSYTVTPQTYIPTDPAVSGTKSSFVRVIVLFTFTASPDLHAGHRHGRHAFAAPEQPEPLGALGFDADRSCIDSERVGQPLGHLGQQR